MSLYLDAVLDGGMTPLFNGTPEETLIWLNEAELRDDMQVCIGKTMQLVTVEEYLRG